MFVSASVCGWVCGVWCVSVFCSSFEVRFVWLEVGNVGIHFVRNSVYSIYEATYKYVYRIGITYMQFIEFGIICDSGGFVLDPWQLEGQGRPSQPVQPIAIQQHNHQPEPEYLSQVTQLNSPEQ